MKNVTRKAAVLTASTGLLIAGGMGTAAQAAPSNGFTYSYSYTLDADGNYKVSFTSSDSSKNAIVKAMAEKAAKKEAAAKGKKVVSVTPAKKAAAPAAATATAYATANAYAAPAVVTATATAQASAPAAATATATAQAATTSGTATASAFASVNGSVIANAALAQVGTYQNCAELVTNAIAAAGINHFGWPASYLSLGSTSYDLGSAQPGDLLYYDNAGAGVAHIAVYIGNGMAVHGGWNGNQTVIAPASIGSGLTVIHL